MAITPSVFKTGVVGDAKYVVIDIVGDANSYATGGVDVSAIVNTFIPNGVFIGSDGLSNGTHFSTFDTANKKVQFRLQTTGAEVANGGSTATTIRSRVVGY